MSEGIQLFVDIVKYLFIGAVILGVAMILISPFKRKKKLDKRIYSEKPPEHLGIVGHPELKVMVDKLEQALPASYMDRVKKRVMEHHPDWTNEEYEWKLFELKRYFLLNSIMKTVPMFSDEVDEIWHEMLMFTGEYQDFSQNFVGSFMHHSPNDTREPVPDQRAFFDWVYAKLFSVEKQSYVLWGRFFRNPLSAAFLEEIEMKDNFSIRNTYFSRVKETIGVQNYIIDSLKEQIKESAEMKKGSEAIKSSLSTYRSRKDYDNDINQTLLLSMVFLSLSVPEDSFSKEMESQLKAEGQYFSGGSNAGGTSACSFVTCSTGSDGGSDGGSSGGSSGGDSGGSSSSCGSGCGGGCS